MENQSNQPSEPTYFPDNQPDPTIGNWFWMLGLISLGTLFFVFAHSAQLKSVGVLCITAGFVERIVIEIIKVRLAITKGK
jgi:hypothetical protein